MAKSPENYPNEFCLQGTFLAASREHREWIKDGVQKSMDLDCAFVQTSFGVVVVRAFNNDKVDFKQFKAGDAVCFPIEEYRKDNGVKSVTVRF